MTLTRKTPLRAIAIKQGVKKMKSHKIYATKAQSARIGELKVMGCMACQQNEHNHMSRCDGEGSDAHHLLSGGRRRGHEYTIALCPWHHRGVRPPSIGTDASAFATYGPSMALNPRQFRTAYGGDDELLAAQNLILSGCSA